MSVKQRIKAEIRTLNRQNPNITVFIVYGLLYDVFLNIYKPFAVKFLERMDGTDFHIALFNALPGLGAALALLPGAILIGRNRSKQRLTSAFFLASRLFILLVAFVPTFPPQYQPLLFIAFISCMNLPEAIAQTSLQSFLGVIFDGRLRATAITLRNKFGNIAVPVITLATGLIIGLLPRNDAERIVYYQSFYVAAFMISVLEISVFRRLREKPVNQPTVTEATPAVGVKTVTRILSMPKFLRFMLTTLVFQFTWQAGWPLSSIYQIKTLGANELWLAAFAVIAGLMSFLSAARWNKLIYKRGNGFALVAAAVTMSLNLIFFAISPNLSAMLLAQAFAGVAVIGVNITILNGMLESTPSENRIIAIALYNTGVNLSLFLSPFAANALLERVGIVNALWVVGAARAVAALVLLADQVIPWPRRPDSA